MSGIERGGRLIEQQHVGPVEQRLRERYARALTRRKLSVGTVQQFAEVELRRQFADAHRRPVDAVQVGKYAQVLAHRQALRQVDIRRREIHPRQHAIAVAQHVAAEHVDRAGGGKQHAEQHRQRRRLAGAIAAEQRGRRAGANVEADAAHRLDFARSACAGRVPRWRRRSRPRGRCAGRQHSIVVRQ